MLESESNALPLGDTPPKSKYGVIEGDRTLDLQSHNLAFCQLNYDHHIMVLPEGFEPSTSALEGHCSIQLSYGSPNGAGEGNRTLATSLEGWGSTTELHPRAKRLCKYTIISAFCQRFNQKKPFCLILFIISLVRAFCRQQTLLPRHFDFCLSL